MGSGCCGRRAAESAGLAEVFDPANENPVIGRLDIEEFHAHTDTRLNDTDDPEGFDDLLFVAKSDAHSGLERQVFAGADETASHRDIGGDTDGASAGFEVEKLGIRGKRVADGVATVADSQGSAGTLRNSIVHRDDVAHSPRTHTRTAHPVQQVLFLLLQYAGKQPTREER
jgi:hypothetical protein